MPNIKIETLNTLSDAFTELGARLAEVGIYVSNVGVLADEWVINAVDREGNPVRIEFHDDDLAAFLERSDDDLRVFMRRLSVRSRGENRQQFLS